MVTKEVLAKYDPKVVNEISCKISSFLRTKGGDSYLKYVLTYLAYVIAINKIDSENNLIAFIEENVSEQRAMFVKDVARESIGTAFQIAEHLAEEALLVYLFFYPRDGFFTISGDYGTPDSICKLALRVLDIKEDDIIADFGSGAGDFITLATSLYDNQFYGIEKNTYAHEISLIRAELFSEGVEIELGDMFNMPRDRVFDKIFSNYPFAVKLIYQQNGADYLDSLRKRIPEIKRAISSDWLFNSVIVDHLSDSGKAVAIMTNGGCWNGIDQSVREYYVRNGYIEAVIALPGKLFDPVSIPTTMIVFSRGNYTIRMIDATRICEQGRRQNIITDSNIEDILKCLNEGSENAVTVDIKALQQNDYMLNPSRYFDGPIEIEDGVEFGSIMKRITRGAPLKANELDEMVSEEPTGTQYLMLSNIQNGMISEDLPYLKELDPKFDKYCIENRNLLLSKNGAPFKVAVAEIEDGKKVLGNGNLFIVELNEEKVDPYYIKAFFDSETGVATLKSIVVGTTIPNISAESLKKLMVPLPPMKKQKEIASLYLAKLDEIKVLKLRLQKAQNDLRGIFGEVE